MPTVRHNGDFYEVFFFLDTLVGSWCSHQPDAEWAECAKRQAILLEAAPDLLVALQGILAEPYGCTLCDSGKPRNPAKGHQPDCPYEAARAAIARARGESEAT